MTRLFLHSLANRWLEYLAAALVVAVAVAALVVQGSLASSAEKQVHDLAHNLGKNMLVVPAETDLGGFYSLEYGDEVMPDSYPQDLRRSPLARHLRDIQPALFGNLDVDGVPLVLVGRADLFPPGAGESGAPPAVIGRAAARRLTLLEGDRLELAGHEVDIVQVADSLPDGMDMGVFTSLVTAQSILGKQDSINAMHLGGCWCSLDVPALAAEVERELPDTRAITVAGVIASQQGTIAVVERYSAVLLGVALLLIAGITVVLTTAQLRRQKREIGLLVAIGAPTGRITLLFVAMAATLGFAGGAAGLFLGGPLTRLVADRILGSRLPASPDVFVPIFALTVGASVLAALAPTLRAVRLDPTTTLREI